MKPTFALFLICFGIYAITNYGGVRAPDSEVVFRVAESLADNQTFTPRDLERWPGFGVSPGIDGRLYSVYPPMESFVLVPVIKLAQWINKSGWYEHVPVPLSLYPGNGLKSFIGKATETHWEPHALRYIASWFDVLVSVLGVMVLYAILLRMTGSRNASFVTALIYACGTMAWSYAGSFFSEPLALLFVLMSFQALVAQDADFSEPRSPLLSLLAGISLGLACSTHLTAVLFFPFFAAYAFLIWRIRSPAAGTLRAVFLFAAGCAIVLLLLGYFNYIRFGNFFEFGRSMSTSNKVSFFYPFSRQFWHNLFGVLAGCGKGLLFFCPAVIVAGCMWRPFHKKHPALSFILIALLAGRIMFVACYEDWHAGYCLGPRYLLMAIPFWIIPAAFWIQEKMDKQNWGALAASLGLLTACIVQQAYFALGEIFSFYHILKFTYRRDGVGLLFVNDRIYLNDWTFTPLLHLHQYKRGPFLLQSIGLSNFNLWLISGGLCIAVAAVYLYRLKLQYQKHTAVIAEINGTKRKIKTKRHPVARS